ncbi:hypothetical protein [Streptomyces sp. NPDC059455]|uniref:hypothetical protein n=1 Tax=Streptomyces sp. NPDC059455 TaxID=3346837 RepID=UPI003688B8C3
MGVAHEDLARARLGDRHLRDLARLVREEPRGRQRYYHLEPDPLAEVRQWLHPFEHYWRERLRALRDVLDEENP